MSLPKKKINEYGLLSLLGGIFGYVTPRSKASLISGSLSGVLLMFAAFLEVRAMTEGLRLALIVTLVLLVVFIILNSGFWLLSPVS